MPIAFIMVAAGALLIYSGIKGYSVTGILKGNFEPSKKPKPVNRKQ